MMPAKTVSSTRGAPGILWIANVLMYVQAVASLFVATVQLIQVVQLVRHGQDVPGLQYVGTVVDPLVAVALLISATFLVSKRSWARPLAFVVEAIGIMEGGLNMLSGHVQPVAAILIAVVVIVLLTRPPVGDWIAGRTVV
ncbi:hypothetical protein GCM10009765_63300 [Fodinicola feengrottensis]|uniref:Uncharacterized protein n=2 Tax=Fodinicola feengrottensis TaxID=435914 RepID=A0ABN2IHV8_9ACTN